MKNKSLIIIFVSFFFMTSCKEEKKYPIEKKYWEVADYEDVYTDLKFGRNPDEKLPITDDSPFNLRYMKLHGCAKEIKDNPDQHQRLVITKKDFAQSTLKKGNFWMLINKLLH